MEYRFLGKSGLKVSALSLGAWVTIGQQIGEEVASARMRAAYEAGVNFFDNAEAYLKKLTKKETEILGLTIAEAFADNTREVMHLPDNEYDDLLSRNVAFVYLYDANANNAVIECIARATPLLGLAGGSPAFLSAPLLRV